MTAGGPAAVPVSGPATAPTGGPAAAPVGAPAPVTASVSEEVRLARLTLNVLAEPGDPRFAALVEQMGPVALRDALVAEAGEDVLREEVAERLRVIDPVRELEQASRLGISFLVPGDPGWPLRLDDLAAAEATDRVGGRPLGLWVRGPLPLAEAGAGVAIVGSRSSSTYGEDVARAFAGEVVGAGRPVVSGGAFGIDVAAHRGALAGGGPTVAVLACGVDRAYPAAHKALLDHLARECAVVSETPPGRAPLRSRFLSRNRLIAALTAGTVVVEAAARSGSLSTANWAGRLHRAVMAVPGPVTSAASEGVHEMVRSGRATLVASGAHVLELVGSSGAHLVAPVRGAERRRDRLDRLHQRVLDAVPVASGAAPVAVARTAGVPLLTVGRTLTSLELQGFVVREAAGWRLAVSALG